MRGLRRYSCALLFISLCVIFLLAYQLLHSCSGFAGNGGDNDMLQKKGCNQDSGESTDNFTKHFESLSQRPLLVRFKWYSRKQTPVHVG